MKKVIFISVFFLFLGLAPHVFAEGFVALAPIPGLTQGVTANTAELANFFNNLYKYLIGLAAALAVIQIIWGGLEIAVNKDNVSKITDSKGKIYNAVFGLVLVLSPVLVFSIINPSILNLSLNLPELDTSTSMPSGTSGGPGPGPGTVDPTSGCAVSGTSGILQIAVCPSVAAATVWGNQVCTLDDLAVADLTTINPTNGVTINKSVAICTGRLSYVFIDPGGAFSSFASAVKRLRPLVSVPSRPNNGQNALSFENICKNSGLGLKTCISDIPTFTRAIDCQLTGASAATTWKCYQENLSCEDRGGSAVCDSAPGWVPFQ